ncbi:HAD-IIIA family hydrolase [Aliidiomarina halalkaliphila]|uniref:HAD-IIIA family hydrolase n=1 Tax=Aliidiomarina halalkaliphila TaxID=2593535 RepID=A0A552X456_9GAMM|nr:HAD-IIIA family hydrolase [Aliidiomarina halalkaliphila]TRW49817.1 HAD-IIIA family hydrolase [Aliidiomarina halalkaliphila]
MTNNSGKPAVLFDLDGTLLDTAPDLGFALNSVLRRYDFPEKSADEIRPHASHGSYGLLRLGFGDAFDSFDTQQLRQEFLDIYEAHTCVHTVLFPGVADTLARLHEQGIKLAIVTNKPTLYTTLVLREFKPLADIDVVVCGDTLPVNKPHPDPLLLAAKQLEVAAQDCFYVGDAERDIEAGRRASMETILAAYGYLGDHDQVHDWGADHRIERFSEILQWYKN